MKPRHAAVTFHGIDIGITSTKVSNLKPQNRHEGALRNTNPPPSRWRTLRRHKHFAFRRRPGLIHPDPTHPGATFCRLSPAHSPPPPARALRAIEVIEQGPLGPRHQKAFARCLRGAQRAWSLSARRSQSHALPLARQRPTHWCTHRTCSKGYSAE